MGFHDIVIVMFNALVNFLIVTVEGVTIPRSIFDKCGCVIPARSASCSWVRLAISLAVLILSCIVLSFGKICLVIINPTFTKWGNKICTVKLPTFQPVI
jgi:hypothetical protein